MKYTLTKFVKTSFKETLIKLKRELINEDFIVMRELDLRDMLNKKLEVEIGNYKIFNIYNPLITYKALLVDKDVGLMLPFSIVVRELKNNQIRICAVNYSIAMRIFSDKDLIIAASAISNKLKKILAKL